MEDASKPDEPIVAFKGFDKNLQCRGFQYEVGKTFKHKGKVKACERGLHACENPLDVFSYYEPGNSRFALVEATGSISREKNGDSKIAAASLSIKAELTLPEFVGHAISWVTAHCSPAATQHATGYRSASSATGDRSASSATGDSSASSATGDSSASSATGYSSASSATGYSSASSATGYRSASSATGYRSASSATGDSSASSATGDSSASSATGYRSASSATGYSSASSATGDSSASSATGYRSASSATGYSSASSATGYSSASSATGYSSASSATGYRSASSATGVAAVALNTGRLGKAKASEGGAIVVCVHNDDGSLRHIRCSKVGQNGIKPDVFYTLSESGDFVEAAA